MNPAWCILVLLVVCFTFAAAARGQVEVTLPLEGYFRAGQYLPVRLRAAPGAALRDVSIGGEGIVPTVVSSTAGEILVPVLVTRATAHELVVTGPTIAQTFRLALRELPADRQMIALIRDARDELGRFVPPAPTVVRVELDRELVRGAPPVAMELLQSLLVDDPALVADTAAWVAAGVQVLLVGRTDPDEKWPWIQTQGLNLLRVDQLGPRTSIIGEAAYLPARGWSPGRSPALRRQVVLGGVLFAIVALACALLPRRAVALAAVMLVTLGACAVIYAWRDAHAPLNLLAGQVAIDHGHVAQWDGWTYLTARPRTRASMPVTGAARPVLVDAEQTEACGLRLHWSDDASRRFFEFDLASDARIGFLSRAATTAPLSRDVDPLSGSNAFAGLARSLYRGDGYAIGGQLNERGAPVVVIVRKP
jgi:hypothetical protein